MPFAYAFSLAQEYIVVIFVRPDAAPGCRKTDHQVIDTPIRNEIDCGKQCAKVWQVFLDVLHQQGPILPRERGQDIVLKRTMPDLVMRVLAVTLCEHQPGLHVLLCCQPRKLAGIKRWTDTIQSLRHEQRTLLPILGKKCLGRQCRWESQGLAAAQPGFLASDSARPVYDDGVSSSKRFFASPGISSDCIKSCINFWSTIWPRVNSLSFS